MILSPAKWARSSRREFTDERYRPGHGLNTGSQSDKETAGRWLQIAYGFEPIESESRLPPEPLDEVPGLSPEAT